MDMDFYYPHSEDEKLKIVDLTGADDLKEDYEILEESNHYESNYDPGEPPEWVPTIVFKVK